MKYKVAVIVPVYNVEMYLKQCLDSLVNQSLKELQIIVVNDGSKDNSQQIISEYANKYPNLLSLTKANGGLSDARNYGLKYVEAEYLTFLDSDDYVELDMYEKMYDLAKKNDSQLVICDVQYEFSDHSFKVDGVNFKANQEIEKAIFISPLFAWNKLYASDFFLENKFLYPKDLWYEDIPVTLRIFSLTNKISYLNEAMVHYRQRTGSIMASKSDKRMFDIFKQLLDVYEYYHQNKLLDQYHDEIEYLFIEHLLWYGAFRFLRSDLAADLVKESKSLMKYFPNYYHNPYLKKIPFKDRLFILTNKGKLANNIYARILRRRV